MVAWLSCLSLTWRTDGVGDEGSEDDEDEDGDDGDDDDEGIASIDAAFAIS